ncbi:MAG: hypothetical protein ACRBBU_03810 [Pseudooceanicola sp.]
MTLLKGALFLGVLAAPGIAYVFDLFEVPADHLGLGVIGFYVLVTASILGPWIKRHWW